MATGVQREPEADARNHPQRSLVLEALDGMDRTLTAPSMHPARLGDRLLLCSDGVSDYLTDEQISLALEAPGRGAAAQRIVEWALDAGSSDNVSVVVADVIDRHDEAEGWLNVLTLPHHDS